jgi:hypothetical protein
VEEPSARLRRINGVIRRAALVVIVVAAVLALAPTAWAKGPIDLEICGASDCRTFHDRTHWRLVTGVLDLYGAFSFARTAEPAPYYELRIEGPGMEEWLGEDRAMYFVPSRGVVRTPSTWIKPRPALLRSLRAAVRGLRPWPRPELTRVTVNGRSADAASYEFLLGYLPVAEPAPELGDPVEIRVFFERMTAWTTARRSIQYFPTQRILHRDTEWFGLPGDAARRLEADAGLVPPPARPRAGGSDGATLLAAAVAATLAALAAAAVGLRRARRPRAASA